MGKLRPKAQMKTAHLDQVSNADFDPVNTGHCQARKGDMDSGICSWARWQWTRKVHQHNKSVGSTEMQWQHYPDSSVMLHSL